MNQEGMWYRDSQQQMKCLSMAVWQNLAGNDRVGVVGGKTSHGDDAIYRFIVKVDANGDIKYLVLEDREVITGKAVIFNAISARMLSICEEAKAQALALHDATRWKQAGSLVLNATAQIDLWQAEPGVLATKTAVDSITCDVLMAAGLAISPPVQATGDAAVAVCPSCQSPVAGNAKFCGECGAKVGAIRPAVISPIPSIRLATLAPGTNVMALSLEDVSLKGPWDDGVMADNYELSGIVKLEDVQPDWEFGVLSGLFLSADGRGLESFGGAFGKDDTEIPFKAAFVSPYRGSLSHEVCDFQLALSVTAFAEKLVSVGTIAVPKRDGEVNVLASIEMDGIFVPYVCLFIDDADPDVEPYLKLVCSIQNVSRSALLGAQLVVIGRDAKGGMVFQSDPEPMERVLLPQGITVNQQTDFPVDAEDEHAIVQVEVMLRLMTQAATGWHQVRGGEVVSVEGPGYESGDAGESESDESEDPDAWDHDGDGEPDAAIEDVGEGDDVDQALVEAVGPGEIPVAPDGNVHAAIEVFLSKGAQRIPGKRFFFAPHFNAKKLSIALESYAPGVRPEDVLLFIDSTTFGGAKEGLLITREKLYAKNLNERPVSFPMSGVESVDYKVGGFLANMHLNGMPFFAAEGLDKGGMGNLAELLLQLATALKATTITVPRTQSSPSPSISAHGKLKVHAAWDEPDDDRQSCRWFVAWQSIGRNQIAGVVAGFSDETDRFEVERFWGELEDGTLSQCWIDCTDRVTDEEVDFSSLSDNIAAVCENASALLWEWNDENEWNDSDSLYLCAKRRKDLAEKDGLWRVDDGHFPAIGELCGYMAFSDYQEE